MWVVHTPWYQLPHLVLLSALVGNEITVAGVPGAWYLVLHRKTKKFWKIMMFIYILYTNMNICVD